LTEVLNERKKKPGRLDEPTGPRRKSLRRHTTSSPHIVSASQDDPDALEATTNIPFHPSISTDWTPNGFKWLRLEGS
jgi:hypothetical protein